MKTMMKTLKHVPKAQQQFVMLQLLGAQQSGSSRSPPVDLSSVIQMCQPMGTKTPASADLAVEDQATSKVTSPSTPHAAMTLGNSLQRMFAPALKVPDARPSIDSTTSSMPAPRIPALMDTPTAMDHVAGDEAEDDDDPLRDLEKAIGDAVEQKAKNKAAAKQAAKLVNKRPAAAEPSAASTAKSTGATLKRPASALTSINVDMRDVFTSLKKVKKGEISYGAYTSRAFDTAKRRALKTGACKDDALAFARSNFAIASSMYYASHLAK